MALNLNKISLGLFCCVQRLQYEVSDLMMRKAVLLSFLLVSLLVACQQQEVAPYHHLPTGISFTDFLGELKRETITDYEKQEPGLGVGVRYHAPNLIGATIYVYNYRLKRIPNGVDRTEVNNQVLQAENDIYETQKVGRYKSVVKLSDGVRHLGGADAPWALWAYFSLNMDGADALSHLYLAVYKDHFIKIRFSYAEEQKSEGEKSLSKFLDDVGRLLVARKRGPSTPQEQSRAVEIVTSLEENPFSYEANQYRRDLFIWLDDVPDIRVKFCTEVLGDYEKLEAEYRDQLMLQLPFSGAKFIIQKPDKARDDYRVYLAQVEGVLRTYMSMKRAKPKLQIELLEELLGKEKNGALGNHVKANMAGCKGIT